MEKRKIVSSRHLAESEGWQLSEVEYGLILAHNGFSRWVSKCMVASGYADLSVLEILVLHNVNHRGREKRLTDICFLLNIDDSHTVNYALKKLLKAALIQSEKERKCFILLESGVALCDKYRQIREQCLLDSLSHLQISPDQLSDMAAMLRTLSGLYDQASRAAASYDAMRDYRCFMPRA